ncbi:MAG: HAMP domain-containing histidine kinase [Planctomycetaceae bacterium]|nr:HAMP domain-containing histidine kinase [Planctomycetaceae bacterium]
MTRRRSFGWPITLATVMIVLIVALIVGWILLAVATSRFADYRIAFLAVGTTFLVLVLVGVVLYLIISLKEIALNQRQANFIDSVTHELKSPIASLKLYLQTLARRTVTEAEQAEFHRMMLQDLDRLDQLINHLLDAARVDTEPGEQDVVDVDLANVLASCAATSCQRYAQPADAVAVHASPAIVRGKPIEIEMIFRNLLDNALKYSGEHPQVTVESWINLRGMVVTRVADNGPGIPQQWRRKIFSRFFRIGSELERKQPGTGLGLYIVDTLVRRMRGSVFVRSRGNQGGTVFEVQLPGRAAAPGELQSAPGAGQSESEYPSRSA